MIGLKRALQAIGVLGAVLIAVAVAIVLESNHLEDRLPQAIIGGVVAASYIGTGLFAWWRRPRNRVGMLMTAVGFAYFFSALTAANSSFFFTVGMTLESLHILILAHMLLAFPTGRLQNAFQRRLVAAAYAIGLTVPLVIQLFDPDCGCGPVEHPANAFVIADVPWAAAAAETFGGIAGVVLTVTAAAILIGRWRRGNRRERHALAPVLLTGAVLTLFLCATLALDIPRSVADGAEAGVDIAVLLTFAALPYAFLVGLARSRAWRAGAIEDVLDTLGEAPGHDALRGALREAVEDPTLELAYWLEDRGVHVGPDGRPIGLPAGDDPARVVTPVEREGRRVGALVHARALADDPELLRAVGAAAALALDNERLDAELRARVEELRDSRERLLSAGWQERRRLERDLHDGAQQRLVALSLQLGLISSKLDRDPKAARELLDGARAEARATLEDLRELARGIHPAVLTDRGLGAALESLAERAPVPVDVAGLPNERLPEPVEAAAYFVVAESLTNVAKYAGATHAEVRVGRENGYALIEVRDDGVGGADPASGTGLRGLADRLEALDGRLEVDSAPGRGTVVRAKVPCRPA